MENNKYNTKVTKEEIVNGIKDEYGCVYSQDGKRLLEGNDKITSYVIKDGTEVICDFAFKYSLLRNIVVPESVTSIGYQTFYSKSLRSIAIPKSVTTIGNWPFSLGIEITSHSNRFVVENDLLIDLEEKRLIRCLKNREHIVIPESVITIGDYAFSYCKSLQSIVIPNSVISIGNWAFRDCRSLQSIVIPNSVTTIGYQAFGCCSTLQSIAIPNSVTTIGSWAFYFCKFLQNIVIPDSVTEIGDYAFSNCLSLESIVIPDSVTRIGYSFRDCSSLQSIVIPKGKMEYFKIMLNKDLHHLLKEIDYKKIYNVLGFCYEFGMGYKRDMKTAEEYYAKAKELEDKEKDLLLDLLF